MLPPTLFEERENNFYNIIYWVNFGEKIQLDHIDGHFRNLKIFSRDFSLSLLLRFFFLKL